jgi:hypothetical protein
MNDPFSWMFGNVPERFRKWMYLNKIVSKWTFLNKIEFNGTFTWTFHFAELSDASKNVQERLWTIKKGRCARAV